MLRLTLGHRPPFSRRRKRTEPPSGGYSPACHHTVQISILCQSVWDLRRTKPWYSVFSHKNYSTNSPQQGSANSGCQLRPGCYILTGAATIFQPLGYDLLLLTFRVPRTLRWYLDFYKTFAPFFHSHISFVYHWHYCCLSKWQRQQP